MAWLMKWLARSLLVILPRSRNKGNECVVVRRDYHRSPAVPYNRGGRWIVDS